MCITSNTITYINLMKHQWHFLIHYIKKNKVCQSVSEVRKVIMKEIQRLYLLLKAENIYDEFIKELEERGI